MKCWSCGAENLPGTDTCAQCQQDLSTATSAHANDPVERELLQRQLADLVTSDFVEIAPTDSIRDAIAQIDKSGKHCALVIEGGHLVGIFTERDVLTKVADRFEALSAKPVSDFMTAAPETLSSDASVAFALNRMTVGGFRHVPILRNGHPIGLVSVRDILSYLVKRFPGTISAPSA